MNIFYTFCRTAVIGAFVSIYPAVEACGQADYGLKHPQAAGSGGCIMTRMGAAAPGGNPAGVFSPDNITLLASHHSRFSVKELASSSLGCTINTGSAHLGAWYTTYGFPGYSGHLAALGAALPLSEKIRAGVQLKYYRSRYDADYRPAGALSFSAGVRYLLSEKIILGLYADNPAGGSLGDNRPLPVLAGMGVQWSSGPKTNLYADIVQQLSHPLQIRTGIDYSPVKNISVLFGVSNPPAEWSFGCAILKKKLRIHTAFVRHQVLGWSPSLALEYGF